MLICGTDLFELEISIQFNSTFHAQKRSLWTLAFYLFAERKSEQKINRNHHFSSLKLRITHFFFVRSFILYELDEVTLYAISFSIFLCGECERARDWVREWVSKYIRMFMWPNVNVLHWLCSMCALCVCTCMWLWVHGSSIAKSSKFEGWKKEEGKKERKNNNIRTHTHTHAPSSVYLLLLLLLPLLLNKRDGIQGLPMTLVV